MPKVKAPKDEAKKTKSESKSGKAARLYSNFAPIPVSISGGSTHYIYVRPHKSSPPSENDERTLFAANLPVDADEHGLRSLFGKWGVVESVEISRGGGGDVLEAAVRGLPIDESDDEDEGEDEENNDENEVTEDGAEPTFMGTAASGETKRRRRRKPNTLPPSVPDVTPLPEVPSAPGISGVLSARIIFIDSVSISRAMGYAGPPLKLAVAPLGLSFFETQYAALRPTLAIVREHSDSAMARYDHLHSLLLSSRAKAQGAGALVDEDGFTVVVRGGRYGRTAGRSGDAGGAVAVASRNVDEKKKKKKGSGPLGDFYRFQLMDRKRKDLADLRARFDEDRKKVDALKTSKRFRPY